MFLKDVSRKSLLWLAAALCMAFAGLVQAAGSPVSV